ncbi:amidohydrolase [uncultured Thomasclavelia sp.]|uniref:amidohydrolase n=1 Tax=uncultured Thomasclavelia sp. TaxID=3025759 RepID=UPI0025E31836|nr:amidohydrolase [uncultured Thomasclavelia sp.]
MKIYYHGNLYGCNATALVEKEGKIIFVGSDEEALKYKGQKIDLKQKYVYPGFNDSHMHLVNYGQFLKNVQLEDDSYSLAALLTKLKNSLKKGQWLIGRGWNHDLFQDVSRFPTREDLDKISQDEPIVITRVCGHILVANSKAIELAKINNQTVDGGSYDLTTGLFKENAMSLIYNAIKKPTVADIKESIMMGQKQLHAYGITSVQSDDFLSATDDYHDALRAFEELAAEDKLTIRVYEQSQFTNLKTLKQFIDEGYYTGVGSPMFKIGPLKMLGDGSLGARTAFMSEPYYDDPTTQGIPVYTKDEFKEMFDYANKHQMQIAIHAIGDKILDWIIEAYEYALNNYPRPDHRHGIVHCQVTRKDQLLKFKELKLHAYIQSIFLDYDSHIINQRVKPELAKTSYNFKTLQEIATISNGSDCPVEKPDVLKGIQLAVTRKAIDGTGPYLPKQALSRQEAIDSFTKMGAYASFEEDVKGSIKPGHYCDLVILDEDILTVADSKIKDIKILATIVGGKLVYGGI